MRKNVIQRLNDLSTRRYRRHRRCVPDRLRFFRRGGMEVDARPGRRTRR